MPGLGEERAISSLHGELGPAMSGEDALVSATLSPATMQINIYPDKNVVSNRTNVKPPLVNMLQLAETQLSL